MGPDGLLLSAVSVLVVAQSSSEIPEGLMNNPVLAFVFVSLNKFPWNPLVYDTNPLQTKRRLLYFNSQFVPRSKKLYISVVKTKQFMLYRAEVAVCSEIHTKQINTMWAECIILKC